jgi:nitrogen-specific signal transduction histidine kinase
MELGLDREEDSAVVVDLRATLRRSLRLARTLLPPAVELEVNLDPALPDVVANGEELDRVVLALCAHCAAVMPLSEGRIDVTAVRTVVTEETRAELGLVRTGPHALIAIAGSADGAANEDLRWLCGGSGLELATARSILRYHDGALFVHGGPGRGTWFTLWIPTVPISFRA